MTALRPVLASVLLVVLAVGGVVLPSVHRAAHAVEVQAERDAHHDAHHGDGEAHASPAAQTAPLATAPCPPLPHDVDCAVCGGVSFATSAPASPDFGDGASGDALDAQARWVRTQAAHGAGARAPPAS